MSIHDDNGGIGVEQNRTRLDQVNTAMNKTDASDIGYQTQQTQEKYVTCSKTITNKTLLSSIHREQYAPLIIILSILTFFGVLFMFFGPLLRSEAYQMTENFDFGRTNCEQDCEKCSDSDESRQLAYLFYETED
ncbi:hypothetical protein GJ496_001356 [Pomphorhynchus laevis]|nr:hypothetical protein GJ496_001356 [Pomphorhynchus laevis]